MAGKPASCGRCKLVQKSMTELNQRQQAFVDAYLIMGNATRAAEAAGYSQKTARVQGARLLSNAAVSAAIDRRNAERLERVAVDQDMVLAGLLREAQRMDEGASHSARVTAWTQLGKHLKMFTDKVEAGGPDGGPMVIERLVVDPGKTKADDSNS